MNWNIKQHKFEAKEREARARKRDLIDDAYEARRKERLAGYWERLWGIEEDEA